MEIAQLSGIELVIASLKRFPTEPGVQEKLGGSCFFENEVPLYLRMKRSVQSDLWKLASCSDSELPNFFF